MENDFNEYLSNYKKLPLKEKQEIVFEQLKMLASMTHSFCKEINAQNEIIINKELTDLKDKNYTEDDFVEAILVLTNSIQNSICDFHLKMSEIIENMNE
ncbi:MAG TPA: hypothetical protein IAC02_04240 [Candidatus Coprovivens excrementavium]|nr:hypothetical protein [Candidatus Coprovivens excrementavium]